MMRLLLEFLKDSKRSDRKLAKAVGVSQPTITRMRSRLVREEMIKGFTVIPDFVKMGYNLLAFTFVKTKHYLATEENHQSAHESAAEWMMKQPNVIYCDECRGMGMTGFMVSLHKSYPDFDKFMFEHNHAVGVLLDEVQTVFVNLRGDQTLKPLHFKYLGEQQET